MAIKIRKKSEPDEEPPEDEEEVPEEAELEPGQADPFLRGSAQTISWFSEHQNLVFGGAIGVVLVAIGVWAGFSYTESQQVAASSTLSPGLAAYEIPVEGSPTYQQLKQASQRSRNPIAMPEASFPNDKKRWTEVLTAAETTLEKHGQNRVAQHARLAKGAASTELGKYDQAVEAYETYLKKQREKNATIPPHVYHAAGAAHGAKAVENDGSIDKAIEYFDKLKDADAEYKGLAIYQKAVLKQKAGQLEEAEKLLQNVLETDSQSPYKTDVNRRLAMIRHSSGDGGGDTEGGDEEGGG